MVDNSGIEQMNTKKSAIWSSLRAIQSLAPPRTQTLHLVSVRHGDELVRFYQKATGDMETDVGAIAAQVARLPVRKRQFVEWRLEGLTLKEISEIDGHIHSATLSSFIRHIFHDIHRVIHHGGWIP
jgi:hypothetical protein